MAIKVRRIDFSPDEWIAGTLGLSVEEEGLYIKICALIWSTGGRITTEHLKRCTATHGNKVNTLLHRLEVVGKIVRKGSEIGQKRAENELENAQKRARNWRENGAKGGRPNGLDKPNGSCSTRAPANHQPSTGKEEGFSPKELNPVFLTASDAPPPPLPSQGDGGADALLAPTTKVALEPTAIDPALLAYGLAKFDDCLAILKGKQFAFDSDAGTPAANPRILEFRARLARINTVVGERMRGNERSRAWDIIGQADAIGDPERIPPDMLAALDSLEGAA